jgi:diketogulonate reductase-like aldo/keto reductase
MTESKSIEQVCFDKNIQGLDPASVYQVELASGRMMPVAAFGTFHSDWAQEYMTDATMEAIRLGWRHLDTARAYENEDVVGEAIRKAINEGYISSTDELFITGKLWNGHMDPKDVAPALDNTLKALGSRRISRNLG